MARAESLGRSDLPLHISARVRLRSSFEPDEEAMTSVYDVLRTTMTGIAGAMGIDEATAAPWVDSRLEEVEGAGADGIFLAAAMVLPDLESRQQVLSSTTLGEALNELVVGLQEIRRDLGLEEE